MNPLFLGMNICAIILPILIAWLCSKDRKHIDWRSVGVILGIELILGAFLVFVPLGRTIVQGIAGGFEWLVNVAFDGISFALPDWVTPASGQMNFVTSALLPILFVVPLFDILSYIGFMPFVIKWIGRGISFVTGRPRFESFFSVEMMFLGNTEAIAVSRLQLQKMSPLRNLTIAMMSVSCVTASILGAYMQMVPGEFVITAIPLNILGAIIFSSILNPVEVPHEEDFVVKADGTVEHHQKALIDDTNDVTTHNVDNTDEQAEKTVEKQPFFSYLGDSILSAGKLILIILANVIAFVALAAFIDKVLALTTLDWLTLQNILGVIMFPFASLLGFAPTEAFELAQFMGTKLVTNEFVVMGNIHENALFAAASPHFIAVTTVFITSFANFSTIGMVTGVLKGIVSKEANNLIAKNVPRLFLSGILVSLLSAAVAGVFVW